MSNISHHEIRYASPSTTGTMRKTMGSSMPVATRTVQRTMGYSTAKPTAAPPCQPLKEVLHIPLSMKVDNPTNHEDMSDPPAMHPPVCNVALERELTSPPLQYDDSMLPYSNVTRAESEPAQDTPPRPDPSNGTPGMPQALPSPWIYPADLQTTPSTNSQKAVDKPPNEERGQRPLNESSGPSGSKCSKRTASSKFSKRAASSKCSKRAASSKCSKCAASSKCSKRAASNKCSKRATNLPLCT